MFFNLKQTNKSLSQLFICANVGYMLAYLASIQLVVWVISSIKKMCAFADKSYTVKFNCSIF